MFTIRPFARAFAQKPWVCPGCLLRKPISPTMRGFQTGRVSRSKDIRQTQSVKPGADQQAQSFANIPKPKARRSRRVLIVLGSVIVLLGASQLTEGGRFGAQAVVRASRVVNTLYTCINDYRDTLPLKESQDPQTYDQTLKACHKRCAERTLVAMEKNGSIFIKLGQHLTSLNYMLPSEWCETFIPLQDQCPKTSFQDVKAMIEHDTSLSFAELFSEFEEEPLGAASLAQVHRAVEKSSGQKVAVKAQHPVLDYWAPLDLMLTDFTFSTIKRFFPDYDLTWLSDEMHVSLPQELDFSLEGDNALRARSYFSNISTQEAPLIIPNVLWSKRRILVMEYITGHRPDDLKFLDTNNISRDEVSASLARIFNIMIFSPDAPLHCDPHGGNIAIRPNTHRKHPHNFDIILYDHGLYRTIPRNLQRSYAKLWLSVLDADEPGMRQHAYDVAGITSEQFPLFASAITGRDYRVVTQSVASTPRTDEEKQAISDALGEGMLQELVQLLGNVPRIILLILKTNDLTRSLDSALETKHGPMRSFLILARYAARTVWEEQVEMLKEGGRRFLFWPPRNAFRLMSAWVGYVRVVVKLGVYEWWLYMRGMVGLENPAPGPPTG